MLAAAFVVAGVLHFTRTDFYMKIMPPYLPMHRELVYASGMFEILGGVFVLLPFTRRAAGIGLILLLLAVFPANVYMLTSGVGTREFGIAQIWLWLRLPLQAMLMLWVWWCAIKDER